MRERDEKFNPRSTSDSRITSHYSSPAPPQAASTDTIPPAYLLPPPVPPPDVKLDHTAHFCCSRASPLVCPNQPLCEALDVLKRGRALESNERSALSYSRAIAVSPPMVLPSFHPVRSLNPYALIGYQRCSRVHLMLSARPLTESSAFPRKITAKERREVQKLPYIGAKISKMVCGACARPNTILYPFLYSHQADRRIPLPWSYTRSRYVLCTFYSLQMRSKQRALNRDNERVRTLQGSLVVQHHLWHRTGHSTNTV